ncbi:DUF6270 domain-containing protein [Pseudomonas putida]|uniref:DUF6270 domain-containing protein n=1 Tax=Pseudomonas putida TaxID=303 RepID=UPI0021F8383F|nr:DUF6270 domain-containing protein [Pseudomonas putida]
MIKNLLIYGSCVSRDIFNLKESRNFKLTGYFARSSMASLCSEPYNNTAALNRIPSAFQRRMVAYDFSKELITSAHALAKAHTVLIDLIDERFDLIALPTGHIITYSSELTASGLLDEKGAQGFRVIPHGSDEHRALWLQGMHLLFEALKNHNKLDRVIVNKVFWASKFEQESDSSFPVTSAAVDKANRELEWMYEQLGNELDDSQFLHFEPELLTADAFHRWGASPFHYCERYYQEALSQINSKQKVEGEMDMPNTTFGTDSPPVSSGVKLSVAAYRTEREVFAHCSLILDGRICDSGNFAFYLLNDGNRHDARWYDASESARFLVPNQPGELTVVAFYKDDEDKTITLKCDVLPLTLS